MTRRLINREEQGKFIAQTSGAISMINESKYIVRSVSGCNTYTVIATQSGWVCSCPDYLSRDIKCKHVYAVEFYPYRNNVN
jgi:putative transposase